MTNRLADEKSPYLLQHKENPVDWYPWGDEALERAAREDRPILVSIGYSACHWCHVMERESFEDPETARLMNDNFVCIKVDREERPDVDAVYMEAVQALSGHGGWPLNVFLTPDRRPFFGGTYFPPRAGRGMPSWRDVLHGITEMYRDRRGDVMHNADAITAYIRQAQNLTAEGGELSSQVLRSAWSGLAGQIDWRNGGLGSAPKFPQPLALEFALHMSRQDGRDALRFVRLTLDRMAAGGIRDHIGGGFHRYSVDDHWLVPHFEKMLYDNALLASVYLHAYQATGDRTYREVTEDTLGYLLQDMRAPEGAFYAAEDADSEGVEGKFYLWTPQEFQTVLEEDWEPAAARWGVKPGGNFEGATILTLAQSVEEIAASAGASVEDVGAQLHVARERLYEARKHRVSPGKDDKILASWNALAIRAFAEAGRVLDRPDYLDAARTAMDFVLTALRPGGELLRSYRNGPSTVAGFLEDYAYLSEALLTMYEAALEERYLTEARDLIGQMVERFWDPDRRAFYDTQSGSDELPVRPRNLFDNPIPSGTSSAIFAILRLQALTGEQRWDDYIRPTFQAGRDLMERAPSAVCHLLCALDFYLSTPLQVAITGDLFAVDTLDLVRSAWEPYLPNRVIATGHQGSVPLLEGRVRLDGHATAYVCRHFACRLPVTQPDDLRRQLTSES